MKILELLMRETLPQKEFFHAAEVIDLLDITQQQICFWETEFPQVRPRKTSSGQRVYRRQDVILFSAIRHLLEEKNLPLVSAQRIIAESDDLFSTPVDEYETSGNTAIAQQDETLFHDEADIENHSSRLTENRVLEEAARLLGVDEDAEDFDELTQQIYQNCATELEQSVVTAETNNVYVMLEEVIADDSLTAQQQHSSKLAYEKTLASLKESKNSLTEILGMLDKYHESKFWQGFKEPRGKSF